jgi:hypothetical protein
MFRPGDSAARMMSVPTPPVTGIISPVITGAVAVVARLTPMLLSLVQRASGTPWMIGA